MAITKILVRHRGIARLGLATLLADAALAWAARVGEEDLDTGTDPQLGVLGQLLAAVPGQRSAELIGQRGDRCGDRVSDNFGTVAGRQRRHSSLGMLTPIE